MKRCGFFVFVSLLGFSVGFIPRIQAETVTIAYLQDGLNELQKTEKQVALKFWIDELSRKGDFGVDLLPVATMSRLEELLKAKAVNYAIINAVHYLRRQDELKDYFDRNFWAIQRSEALYEEYVVVTRRQKNIKNFSQLSGKQLSIAKDNLLMNFYLKYLVLKSGYSSSNRFFKKIKDTHTASQAVLDIYFGKSDACIVPRHILDMTVELNPSIMDGIRIIHRSGANFIPVLIIGAAYNPAFVDSVFSESIKRIHKSPRSEQIINLFKIHSAVMIGPEQLSAMNSIYSEYKKLTSSVQ